MRMESAKNAHSVNLIQILAAGLPVFILECLMLAGRLPDRFQDEPADRPLLFLIVAACYALTAPLMLVLLRSGTRIVSCTAGRLRRPGSLQKIRRFRILIVAAVFITVSAGSLGIARFFTRRFADSGMVAWALFIIIGTLVWVSLSLLVLLLRTAADQAVDAGSGSLSGESARSARPAIRLRSRRFRRILFHPLILPGYSIAAAFCLNIGWIGHVVDLPAIALVLVWVLTAIPICSSAHFKAHPGFNRIAVRASGFLILLLPLMLQLSPRLGPHFEQHGFLSRYTVKFVNRLVFRLSGSGGLPGGGSLTAGENRSAVPAGTGEEAINLPPSIAQPVRPENFDFARWAAANRQDYPWPDEASVDPAAAGREWNVILITVDALRADHMSCYGYPFMTTPFIDRLARSGVLFERCYAQGGDSIYSLNSLMSGMLPWKYRNEVDPMLQDILATQGFATVYVGYDYVLKNGAFRNGFSETELLPGDRAEVWGRATSQTLVDGIIKAVDRHAHHRFFIYSHLLDPHAEYLENMETERFAASSQPAYDGEIAFTDQHVGRLMIFLNQAGLLQKTLVVLTADHGEAFGEHGNTFHGRYLYDESIRIPLIMSLPYVPERRVRIPVGHVDIAPTILDFLGINPPESMEGISQLPLIYSGDVAGIAPIEVFIHSENYKKRGLIYGPWKYIENLTDGTAELYHLEEDPAEKFNRIGELE